MLMCLLWEQKEHHLAGRRDIPCMAMKLLRFGAPGQERPGVQLAEGVRIDASALLADYDEAFFANGGPAALRQCRASAISRRSAGTDRMDAAAG